MAARVKKTETVLYLYGITGPARSKSYRVTGVDGQAPVEEVSCGKLSCWVSRVPATEFADNLAKNIENLDWLADKSTRHQEVMSALASERDILPARFGTVFLSEKSLCEDVESRKATLRSDLDRISGSEEWGVKVFVTPAKITLPQSVKSGRDYLKAKSSLMQQRKARGPDEEIVKFGQDLERLALATAEAGQISGGRRDLQFQISLLVKRSQREKLDSLLRKYSRQWGESRKIEATGPWPPYSFVSRTASL
jgi:hypothetical protein